MPDLGKALSELLDHAGSPDAAAREIADTPALIAEARMALPALQHAATLKAGEDGVRKVFASRFETYPQTQRTDEQWDAWWADRFDALADIALASLEAGMRAWIKTDKSGFLPNPGQLRELAERTPSRSMTRYYRAKRALQIADEPLAITGPPVDPAQVKSMLAEYEQKMGAGQKAAPMPSIAGPVDEGGLTPMMRDSIERRQEQQR
jgi:hypothetical protein